MRWHHIGKAQAEALHALEPLITRGQFLTTYKGGTFYLWGREWANGKRILTMSMPYREIPIKTGVKLMEWKHYVITREELIARFIEGYIEIFNGVTI